MVVRELNVQGIICEKVPGGELEEEIVDIVGEKVQEDGPQAGEAVHSRQPCIYYTQELTPSQDPETIMDETI